MVNFRFEKIDSIDSTNDYLIRQIENGELKKDAIVVAKEQTKGHGAKGRNFISPRGKGLYFTIAHFYDDPSELLYITQKAAVAVYTTFKEVFGIELAIKWVNDLYYNGKKVCGILCKNLIKYKCVLIGIGIDLFKNEKIDAEIKNIAGYIFENKKELVEIIKKNSSTSKDSCVYKNIIEDFKSIDAPLVDINDGDIWEPDQIVIEIFVRISNLINVKGLPKLYIEKNIVKDERIHEDCDLEC